MRIKLNTQFLELTLRQLCLIGICIAILSIKSKAQNYVAPPHVSIKILASTSSFLSDLGGKNAVGTNDFTDINFNSTRYALGGGIQFNRGILGIGLNSFYTKLVADDRLTTAGRSIRRLSVSTDLIETNLMVELTTPIDFPIVGGVYFNVGFGFMYFQPKAIYNGKVYKLRPLGTEGQNYMPDKEQYGLFAPTIPFGFGKKFQLNNGCYLSLDVSLRKSFTDYLDDVSTTYADPEIIRDQSGDAAAYFADPSLEGRKIGSNRGDKKNNDQYFLIGFRYEIPIIAMHNRNHNTTCAHSNSWIRYDGGVPRFNKRGTTRIRIFK